MSQQTAYQGIHLTGSLPFKNADEVFDYIGSELGPWVARVPDGETGERRNWVLTQTAHFFENPFLEVLPESPEIGRKLARIKPGVRAEDVAFPPFQYPDFATESYPLFKKAKEEGRLAPNAKFQISLPTPFNAVSYFVVLEDQARVLAAYNVQAKAATEEILRRFPHDELAIQWDLPTELVTVQGWFPNPLANLDSVFSTIAEVTSWVPADVDVGYHLCYGDSKFGASPFMGNPEQCPIHSHKDHGRNILPQDIGTVVAFSNKLAERIRRPINFIQAATMRDWDQPQHWDALSKLNLAPETEFYLGLVHASDGLASAQRRWNYVANHLKSFGVSTECGLGRHSQEELAAVTEIFKGLGAGTESRQAAE
ncbi:hypothetical protein [Hyphomicrobium sulfonivorans]|uniref:hypothetical protein n=1 Tax=Hyphomicrobium sulfonivorans TaxID=121290 RepID=UPI00156E54EC|nr:hypothetical protein [Hyphomicrobium sulfonivorans]MBI1649092.1 hypothetical protein [Hyphomicrobium sulfonivorans]NSL70377.1 hypothetical protein [Hyphomicrobium sulfonivorans]